MLQSAKSGDFGAVGTGEHIRSPSQRLLIEGADSQVEQRIMPTSIESSGQRYCVYEYRRGHSHNANETS